MTNPGINQHGSRFFTGFAIAIGDGLIVPFALAAGLTGANKNNATIIIVGIVASILGAFAMALGGYFSTTNGVNQHSKEAGDQDTAKKSGQSGTEKTRRFFADIGLGEEIQLQAVQDYSEDSHRWAAFEKNYGLTEKKPGRYSAIKAAFLIGCFYIAGGIIALLPFFIIDNATKALKFSAGITLTCLFLCGYIKNRIHRQDGLKGGLRLTIIGIFAATAAFIVAKLF